MTTSTAGPSANTTTSTAGPPVITTTSTAGPPIIMTTSTAGPSANTTTSTAGPPANTTTSTAGPPVITTTSTAGPSANTTTSTAGPSSSTTISTTSPSTNTTTSTAGPSMNMTTSTAGPSSSTTISSTSPSSSTTISTTSPSTNTATSTTKQVSCNSQSCKYGATCVKLYHDIFCQCPYGYYYSEGCQLGKIFPGEISLEKQYDPAMANEQSIEYLEVYTSVTKFFSEKMKGEASYKETSITSIKEAPTTLQKLSRAAGNIAVTVINKFETNTSLTMADVVDLIKNQPCSGIIICNSFTDVSQCDAYNCDEDTTVCNETSSDSFPTCDCKQGLAKKTLEAKTCSICDTTECSPEKHKRCSITAKQVPVCQCMAGYREQGGVCKACDFGYSGEKCEEYYLAVLVGVAAACGVIIVVLTGVLIYRCHRESGEPKPDRKSLIGNEYSTTGKVSEGNSATTSAGSERLFPRIQLRSPEQINRAATAGVSNSSYLPERDYDDDKNRMYEMRERM
ncbi:mucin-13 isoform X2 [Anolis carolinensis]|uniref:mucin-13 isoform X2 n=1 Tax=Anolis carolinensis TaxID=28377 RepID=UPI002F2B1707